MTLVFVFELNLQPIVEVFSLLAIATSYIGFVLGLTDFLADCEFFSDFVWLIHESSMLTDLLTYLLRSLIENQRANAPTYLQYVSCVSML